MTVWVTVDTVSGSLVTVAVSVTVTGLGQLSLTVRLCPNPHACEGRAAARISRTLVVERTMMDSLGAITRSGARRGYVCEALSAVKMLGS